MTGFVFIIFYYLFRPIFINFGVSERIRFFAALTLGLLFETTVFLITDNTGYNLTPNRNFVGSQNEIGY